MRYYLAHFAGSGTADDPFVPAGMDQAEFAAAIDLRPDATKPDGLALLAVRSPLPTSPSRIALTDDPDDTSVGVRNRLSSRLGINLDQMKFRRLVMHLLLGEGDDKNPKRWNRLRSNGWQYEVWLGDLLDTLPAISGGAVVTESFNKADSTTLGPDLSWTEVVGDFVISSNTAKDNQAVNADVAARAETDLDSINHYAQADVTWLQGTSTAGGTLVRFASAATTYYRGSGHRSLGADRLHKVVTGTVTQLATQAHTIGAGALNVKTTITGSSLSVLVAGSSTLSVTDTAITTGTRCGIGGNAVTSAARYQWDSFEAGDLSAQRAVGLGGLSLPQSGQIAVGGLVG